MSNAHRPSVILLGMSTLMAALTWLHLQEIQAHKEPYQQALVDACRERARGTVPWELSEGVLCVRPVIFIPQEDLPDGN